MKLLWVFALLSAIALDQTPPDVSPTQPTLADLGLAYSLSSDWILATTSMQKQFSAQNPSSRASVVLAAVYVPQNANFSQSSPFFSLLVFPQSHPDCKKTLDATVPSLEKQDKIKVGKTDQELSAAGRQFYRTDFEQKGVLHRRSLICTIEKNYLLLWNVGARDDEGVEAVISTLNSIAPVVSSKPPDTADADFAPPTSQLAAPQISKPLRVRVSSAVMGGMLVKRVRPSYPTDAREQHIQGTVFLKAQISKQGDVANLEVIEGPIELVGSAVDAVRQWKYRPYLLNGEPVIVETQIQVNYELRWN